jgi:hypothetical protein
MPHVLAVLRRGCPEARRRQQHWQFGAAAMQGASYWQASGCQRGEQLCVASTSASISEQRVRSSQHCQGICQMAAKLAYGLPATPEIRAFSRRPNARCARVQSASVSPSGSSPASTSRSMAAALPPALRCDVRPAAGGVLHVRRSPGGHGRARDGGSAGAGRARRRQRVVLRAAAGRCGVPHRQLYRVWCAYLMRVCAEPTAVPSRLHAVKRCSFVFGPLCSWKWECEGGMLFRAGLQAGGCHSLPLASSGKASGRAVQAGLAEPTAELI